MRLIFCKAKYVSRTSPDEYQDIEFAELLLG